MAPSAIERIKNWGPQINQRLEILPNSVEEAEKRGRIAITVGVLGVIGSCAAFFGGKSNPELLRTFPLFYIPTFGGLADLLALTMREDRLEEKDFQRNLEKKRRQTQEEVNSLPQEEFGSRLRILRNLRSAVEELGGTPPQRGWVQRTTDMVTEVYEGRAKSEGL